MPEQSSYITASQIWQAVLGQLELQVSRPVFDTWLAATKATSLEGSVLLVEVPNPFFVENIEKRMYQTVLRAVRGVAGADLEVRLYVSTLGDAPPQALQMPELIQTAPPPGLNHGYTFATFVVGPSNHLAFTAAQAVTQALGSTYNPLFIYAPPGLGKTHLMHAIAHASHARGAVVSYVTSEHFTNEFIQAIRTKTTQDFRTIYRSVDLLLVDDIQFLAGKEQTLEGFFHTFNDLHTFRKQIVLASEQPPQQLDFLHDKLRSRLESGLTINLQPPDPDTRLAILESKAISMSVTADTDALRLIASIDVNNIRELEGPFTRAVALATLHNTHITTSIAYEAIDVVSKPFPITEFPKASQETVMSTVVDYYGISLKDLTGRKRSQKLVAARQTTMQIMSSELGMGVTDIGKAIARDHSTVSLALKRFQHGITHDPTLQADINAIAGMLIEHST